MAMDCSPGKQIFFNLVEEYFQSFLHIYIYQTLPFVGYLFFFLLVTQINLKKKKMMDGQSSDVCEYC